MAKKLWIIIGSIFFVLSFLINIMFISLLFVGIDMAEKEQICAINICSDFKDVSYFYDELDNTCYCFDTNGQTTKERFIEND